MLLHIQFLVQMRIQGDDHLPLSVAKLARIAVARVFHPRTEIRQVFPHIEQVKLALFQ